MFSETIMEPIISFTEVVAEHIFQLSSLILFSKLNISLLRNIENLRSGN